jgi:hypothetical protein
VNLLTLQDALREVLVGDWKVHTQTSSSPAPASELAPDLSSETLAESTDEPAAADPIALLESGLGARVIGEIDAS